jgi:hypothetical protein
VTNEFAKQKDSLLTGLFQSIDKIRDGVLEFQERADELVEFGTRLRVLSDHLQTRKATLDTSFDKIHVPKGIIPNTPLATRHGSDETDA